MYYEKRQDVPQQDRWDLSHLYKTDKAGFLAWEKEFAKTQKELKKLTIYKGKLKTPTTILKAFDHYSATLRVIEKLYVFASHHYSTDLTNSENSSLQKKSRTFIRPIRTNHVLLPSGTDQKLCGLPK
ncbi:MAG: hypothetical protein ACRCZE_02540 [Candidatus Altimarinota bacterium]